MSVELANVFGNPNVGIFGLATDSRVFLPDGVTDRFSDAVQHTLRAEIVVMPSQVRVLGAVAVGNNAGVVTSSALSLEETEFLSDYTNVCRLESQYYALGNIVLANDYSCVISPMIDYNSANEISKTLEVPVKKLRIASSDLVGSIVCATNAGVLAGPIVKDQEIEKLRQIMGVELSGVGTVNRGQNYVSLGILSNTTGCIAGEDTTGIEIVNFTKFLMVT